ncbi:MAG TPA: DnaB-like helicase C-terminal domain-containing protein [Phycisphaerales bacterium]|nr:DnaB-like helicase C-terminal domain-containing protein [Phycisphaerales bacterium]
MTAPSPEQLRAQFAATRASQMPTPANLAKQQVAEAIARGRLDLSGAPRWPWGALHELVGQMLPGDFVVVCALSGNGKTSFLMSAMDWWSDRGCSTLYIPLETDPHEVRARWAAWKLGLDPVHVLRNEWHRLPEGAQDSFESALDDQVANPCIHFAPPKFITLDEIRKWVRWAHQHLGVRQVILDHFQRVDHGAGEQNAASHRLAVHATARGLKDLSRDLGIVTIAAAQANRAIDPLDAMKPLLLARVKDAAGIVEEANIVLTLSRCLDPQASKEQLAAVRSGMLEEWRVALPNRMVVCCRKHRLDGKALDRRVRLAVEHGRVSDIEPEYPPPRDWDERPPEDADDEQENLGFAE